VKITKGWEYKAMGCKRYSEYEWSYDSITLDE